MVAPKVAGLDTSELTRTSEPGAQCSPNSRVFRRTSPLVRRTLWRTGRVFHCGDRSQPLVPNPLAEERPLQLAALLVGERYSRGGIPHAEQILPLRVRLRL